MKRQWIIGLSLCCLLVVGCVSMNGSRMQQMTTALPRLTSAIVGYELYAPHNGAPKTQEEKLAEIYTDKPELGKIFDRVPVNWRMDMSNRVDVLVCSPSRKWAWLEDASWTPYVDCVWYKTNPAQRAEFTLISTEFAK